MSALSLAVLLALAGDPACGNAPPPLARRLVAIALAESNGTPDAIGINANAGPDRGLMQINAAQLARHGLTTETALNPCLSMRAGAEHYIDDLRAAAAHLASQRYNTGRFDRGEPYAARVDAIEKSLPLPTTTAALPLPVSPLNPFLHPRRTHYDRE